MEYDYINVIKLYWPDEIKFYDYDYGIFINNYKIAIHIPFLKNKLKEIYKNLSKKEIINLKFYYKYNNDDHVSNLKIHYVSIFNDITFIENAHLNFKRAQIFIKV